LPSTEFIASRSPHAYRYASITCLAIGADTCPPVASFPRLPPSRTITATAMRASSPGSAGANAVNHAFGGRFSPFVAVPVLPATAIGNPENAL
jgi:hypothetical protein